MKPRWGILLTPFYLGALLTLFLYDFLLKQAFSGWIIGKLSDFARLSVFTLFWMAFLPRFKSHTTLICGLWFIYWKSS